MGLLRNLTLGLILAIAFCCCNRSLYDFTLYNTKPNIGRLRIDGIYYRLLPPELISRFMRDTVLDGFMLYQNGTYLSSPSYEIYRNNVQTTLKNAVDNSNNFQKRYPNNPGGWGAYEIIDDTLHIQHFFYYEGQTTLYNRYYLIKDSVTLENIVNENSDDIYEQRENNIFKLFITKQKPDSVNVFMNSKRVKRKLDRLYEERNR